MPLPSPDADALLRLLGDHALRLVEANVCGGGEDPDAVRLAELFLALDARLAGGARLPDRWRPAAKPLIPSPSPN